MTKALKNLASKLAPLVKRIRSANDPVSIHELVTQAHEIVSDEIAVKYYNEQVAAGREELEVANPEAPLDDRRKLGRYFLVWDHLMDQIEKRILERDDDVSTPMFLWVGGKTDAGQVSNNGKRG